MEKLFQSFQQLNSKRNRNLEGTGLGLAISQRLLHLMMGSIEVDSQFGSGTKFTFKLPQRIARSRPSIELDQVPKTAAGLISDSVFHTQLNKDISRLGVSYHPLASEEDLNALDLNECEFLFIEKRMYTNEVKNFVKDHPSLSAVLIIDFYDTMAADLPNMIVVKKPIYSLNLAMIFKHENLNKNYNNVTDKDYDFIAPEAQVLIVDDNTVNLTIAEGLLKPLKLQIDTAQSGKESIRMISIKHYDLIFMDHQMPELDGIETTHIIRRFHEEYANVPIIAFSAATSTEMEMTFLNEGLNDCVAKPIELRMLISKLKRWLPREKIEKINSENVLQPEPSVSQPSAPISIEGLDTDEALRLLGSEKLLWDVLKDYYRAIAKKAGLNVADKSESQDICFIPDGNYAGFIERETGSKCEAGSFVDEDGNVLGMHKGIENYTIGQRKGLNLPAKQPYYVKRIIPETNEVVLGDADSVFTDTVFADNINYMATEALNEPRRLVAKIRYAHAGAWCEVIPLPGGRLECHFDEKQRAVTPGQAIVFYEDNYVFGGGRIS